MAVVYNKGWQRHTDTDVAIDKILDAAGQTFADFGVANAKMVDVARLAKCSRGTLYRYFPNQQALHLAYVHRATLRIARRLAEERTGTDVSLTDRIVAGIAAVRADPLLAVWFEPENMAVPIAVSQDSELLQILAAEPFGQLDAAPHIRAEIKRRGEWMLRSIVSLLAMPGADAQAERSMIDSFLAPVLTTPLPTAPRPTTQLPSTEVNR